MAISHVANANGGINPSTSTTLTIPTVAVDDVAILVVSISNVATDPSVTDDDSGGDTWHKLDAVTGAADNASVWYKRMTGSSSGKTVTVSNASADSMSATMSVFRGVIKTGDPTEALSKEANASGNETHASITTSTANAWVIFCIGESDNNAVSSVAAANDPPGGLTTGGTHSSNAGGDTATGIYYDLLATPGATGAVTWAMTDATSGTFLFALKPYVAPAGANTGFFAIA